MRIYIKKIDKNTIKVYKETYKQSLISDFITILTMIFLIGSDIVFSILVAPSYIIDFVIMVLFIIYIFGFDNKKDEILTKEETEKLLKEFLP